MIAEDPLNLSDHLPVVGRLTCRITNSGNSFHSVPKPIWNRLSCGEIAASYTASVHSALSSLPLPVTTSSLMCPSQIDVHLNSITKILSSIAADTIPLKKYLPFRKPGRNA